MLLSHAFCSYRLTCVLISGFNWSKVVSKKTNNVFFTYNTKGSLNFVEPSCKILEHTLDEFTKNIDIIEGMFKLRHRSAYQGYHGHSFHVFYFFFFFFFKIDVVFGVFVLSSTEKEKQRNVKKQDTI